MEDYNKVLEATQVSENASGTAAEKMTIYNDSLTAAQNRLTAAIQEFAENSNISQLMITGIDLLTKIIQLLDLLLNKSLLISPLFRAVGTAFAIAFGSAVIANIVKTNKALSGIVGILPSVISGITGATTATGAFSAVVSALGGPLGIILGLLGGIIAAAPLVVSAWNTMFPSQEKKLQNASEALETANSDLKNTEDQIQEINNKIDEINSQDTLSITDQEELDRLKEERDLLKEIKDAKEENQKKAQDEYNTELTNSMNGKYSEQETSSSGYSSMVNITSLQNTDDSTIGQLRANIEYLTEAQKNLNKEDEDYAENLETNITLLKQNKDALRSKATELLNDMNTMQEAGLENTETYKNLQELYTELQLSLDPSKWTKLTLKDMIDTDGVSDKIKNSIQSGSEAGRQYAINYARETAKKIMSDDTLKNNFAQALNIDPSKLNTSTVTREIYAQFQNMFSSIQEDANETAVSASDAIVSAEENIYNKTNVLAEAYKDMNKQGYITDTHLKNLLKVYPELSSAMEVNNGKMTISAKKLKELAQEQYNTEVATLRAAENEAKAVLKSALEQIEAYGGIAGALAELQNMRMQDSTHFDSTEEQDFNDEFNSLSAKVDKAQQAQQAITDIEKEIQKLLTNSANWNPQSSSGSSGSSGSKKTPQEKALEAAKDAYNLDKTALDTKKEELEVVKSNLEATKEIYETEKDRLENDKDIIEQHKKLLEQELDEVKDAQDAMADLIDLTEKKLKQQYENEKTRLNSIKDYIGEIQDAVDGVKDNYEDVLDKTKEKLKLDKKAEENQKKITDKAKAIADIQRQLAELEFDDSASAQTQKAELLSKLNDAQDDLEEEQKSQAYDQAEQAVDDAKEKLNTIFDQIDAAIDGVESVIDKYINYVSDVLMEDGNLATQALKQVNDMVSGANPELLQELYDFNNKYGDHLESTVTKAFKDSLAAVQKYSDETDGTFTGTYQLLGDKNNQLNTEITADEKTINQIETDIFNTEQKINSVEADIAGVEAKISDVEIQLKDLEISYKKQQLDIQGKSYDSDPDLQKLTEEAAKLREAANNNTEAVGDNTESNEKDTEAQYQDIKARYASKTSTDKNTEGQKELENGLDGNTISTDKNTDSVDGNTASQSNGNPVLNKMGELTGLDKYIDFKTGKIDWKNVGTSMLNFGLQSIQSPTFWSGAIDLISSLLSGTLFSAHEGTNYVSKANSWLDDMLGLGENETARVLEVGEQVIPKGEEVNLTQFDAPFNRDFVTGHPSISNSGNSGDVNIDMGDITANGIDINDLESFLNRKKSEIADYVYSSINKQVKIAGHRNVRGKW